MSRQDNLATVVTSVTKEDMKESVHTIRGFMGVFKAVNILKGMQSRRKSAAQLEGAMMGLNV